MPCSFSRQSYIDVDHDVDPLFSVASEFTPIPSLHQGRTRKTFISF